MRVVAIVLMLVAMAASGCRKHVSPRSFPSSTAMGMNAGIFITTPGTYESVDNPGLYDQFVDFRLSITPDGSGVRLNCDYETRPSLRSAGTNGSGTQPRTTGKVAKGWFVFVEKPGAYWFFDGSNHVHLYGHGPYGNSPTKSIIDGSYVNRDNPKVPADLLARLPEKLSERLSPPTGKRPSF